MGSGLVQGTINGAASVYCRACKLTAVEGRPAFFNGCAHGLTELGRLSLLRRKAEKFISQEKRSAR